MEQHYATFKTLGGIKIDIKFATFGDISKSMFEFNIQPNGKIYDVIPFIVKNTCLFNGEVKELEYILDLPADVYYTIQEKINSLITPLI